GGGPIVTESPKRLGCSSSGHPRGLRWNGKRTERAKVTPPCPCLMAVSSRWEPEGTGNSSSLSMSKPEGYSGKQPTAAALRMTVAMGPEGLRLLKATAFTPWAEVGISLAWKPAQERASGPLTCLRSSVGPMPIGDSVNLH